MPKVQPPELKGFMDKRLSGKIHPSGSTHGKTLNRISRNDAVVSDLFRMPVVMLCLLLQWP